MSTAPANQPQVAEPAAPAKRNRLLELSEKHPYILLGVVILMVAVVIWLIFKDYFSGCSGETGGKRRKKKAASGGPVDEEKQQIDELIDSINTKQKTASDGDAAGPAPAQDD